MREGDVLVEINRKPIPSVDVFTRAHKAAKGEILLLVYREGSTMYLPLSK